MGIQRCGSWCGKCFWTWAETESFRSSNDFQSQLLTSKTFISTSSFPEHLVLLLSFKSQWEWGCYFLCQEISLLEKRCTVLFRLHLNCVIRRKSLFSLFSREAWRLSLFFRLRVRSNFFSCQQLKHCKMSWKLRSAKSKLTQNYSGRNKKINLHL